MLNRETGDLDRQAEGVISKVEAWTQEYSSPRGP
jgi:hypothetical protein